MARRVVRVAQALACAGLLALSPSARAGSIGYTYDAHGRLVSTDQSSGMKTKYWYDRLGNRWQYWAGSGSPPSGIVPVAANDTLVWGGAGSACVQVLANDYSPEELSLSVSAVGTPGHGSAWHNGSGFLCFTSATASATTFTYTVSDGTDTATAQVSVTMHSITANDDDMIGGWSGPPWSGSYSGCVDVLANDVDSDHGLTIYSIQQPSYGSVWISGSSVLCYSGNVYDDDSFTYIATDEVGARDEATVTVDVVP